MKVFLAHARKDDNLARALRERLERAGFSVWTFEEQVTPGDNWAQKMGEALDGSDLMVILLTPRATESDALRQNIEFALSSKRFENRLFTVFVGPTSKVGADIPWILLRLPHEMVESAEAFRDVVKSIQTASHANA